MAEEQNTALDATDIARRGWIAERAPAAWRPYLHLARLDRPVGTWLLLWPCWWAIALASPGLPSLWLLLLFAIGALVMRGAGCAWNDIADRDFDKQVARTYNRPLASGALSVGQALWFATLLSLIGLAVLLSFNGFAIALGLLSLLPVLIYPFMKRVTWWPQFFLGIAFNWGALLGWAAVQGSLSWAPFWLYLGGIAWTLGYDTIYAHQDKEGDALLGLKSSALRLRGNSRPALFGFYLLAILGFGLAVQQAGGGLWSIIGLTLLAGQFFWQAWAVRLDHPDDCLAKFKSNITAGWIFFLAIVIDHWQQIS